MLKKFIALLLVLWASVSGAQVVSSGGTFIASGGALSGCSANSVLYANASTLLACGGSPAPTYDATNIRLQVGTGSTTQQGWILGNRGSGESALWLTEAAISSTNYILRSGGGTLIINSPSSVGTMAFRFADGQRMLLSSTPGAALSITAGTATTAVQALSTTQTWNAAGVTFAGHKYAITDTASAVGSLHSQWLGGAAGATNLMALTKAGNLYGMTLGTSGAVSMSFVAGGHVAFWNTAQTALLGSWTATNINPSFKLASGGLFGWTGNATDGSNSVVLDTGLSRISTGVVALGDGTAWTIRSIMGGGAAVASATALPVPTGSVFHVTGTTTITSITSTNFQAGAVITIIFDGVLTLTDGGNLKLAGNFVTTADDTIQLAYDGTNWFEVARAIN